MKIFNLIFGSIRGFLLLILLIALGFAAVMLIAHYGEGSTFLRVLSYIGGSKILLVICIAPILYIGLSYAGKKEARDSQNPDIIAAKQANADTVSQINHKIKTAVNPWLFAERYKYKKYNMAKIKVQRKASLAVVLLAVVFMLAICGFALYMLYKYSNNVSERHYAELMAILGALPLILGFMFREGFDKKEYVSDIVLTPQTIQLIYRVKGRKDRVHEIAIQDIKKVNITVEAKIEKVGATNYFDGYTETIIIPHNGEKIIFRQRPSLFMPNGFTYLFKMMDYREMLPDFTYNVNGPAAERDYVDYYYQNGRRPAMPGEADKWRIVGVMFFFFALIIGGIVWATWPVMSPFKRDYPIAYAEDKIENDYINTLGNANRYLHEKDYSAASKQINKACKINPDDYWCHVGKVNVYLWTKDNAKAFEEAKKALQLIDEKKSEPETATDKYFGGRKFAKTIILEALGRSSHYLNKFRESVQYYTDLITINDDKYAKDYLWRGASYYRIGDKANALSDFLKHKDIINDYIADNPDPNHPRYTSADLQDIEKRINMAKN